MTYTRFGVTCMVSVTCVTARHASCPGYLIIRQQHTHRLLGETSFHLRLGDTASVPVALRLPAALARAQRLALTASLQPLHGRRSDTALSIAR